MLGYRKVLIARTFYMHGEFETKIMNRWDKIDNNVCKY